MVGYDAIPRLRYKKTKDPSDCYYCDMPAKVDALTLGGRRRMCNFDWLRMRVNDLRILL